MTGSGNRPRDNHDADAPSARAGAVVESISAVTLITTDMARAVSFYEALGFARKFGGPQEPFTSFSVGDNYLNLATTTNATPSSLWGRIIFYVSDVDAFHDRATEAGFSSQFPPRDAEWGERYFHISDPDGHELSFARPLSDSCKEGITEGE
ncbi:MAG: VOC family protein [Planctomycetota bacterium]|nr:VOC family protein [Planctomycetota bacterium]